MNKKELKNSPIFKIDQSSLCLGCGLCESVLTSQKLTMQMGKDGFIHPIQTERELKGEEIISKTCPGTTIVLDEELKDEEKIWGETTGIYSSFSNDDLVRETGSSGGTISEIAIYLLESKKVDGILQVHSQSENYKNNELNISRTKEEVLHAASSRYAPALVFNSIIQILSKNPNERFAFIGKPCDVSTIKNLLKVYPSFENKIVFTIALVCAGMPSINATTQIIDSFTDKKPVEKLRYRGNGWPGLFSFQDKDQKHYSMSYNDSWGNVLGKQLCFRCKICPDGIGLQADFGVGDAWKTKDGYPDFTEANGRSLTMVRTEKAQKLYNEMIDQKRISSEELPLDQLRLIQPYQYKRRIKVGIRVLAFSIFGKVKVNFRNLAICKNLLSANKKELLGEFIGTTKRIITKRIK